MTLYELALYFLLYSFFGWAIEAGYYAVAERRFRNRGFTSLPFVLSYGITFDLLLLVLPTLGNNHVLCILITMIIAAVVEALAEQFTRRAGAKVQWEPERSRLFTGSKRGLVFSLLIAGVYYLFYLLIHPMLLMLTLILPELLVKIVVYVLLGLLAVDAAAVLYVVRTGDVSRYQARQAAGKKEKIAAYLSGHIWRRLQKAYPGIQKAGGGTQGRYIFAQGLCLNKLIWVFLITALLGDIIETFYCGLVDGQWMNRSSVLYGPFSFVWGLGAVVLTVTLRRLAEKNDRYVFFSGFVIGGVYEYMCSVFTELVFGTVFWDYSEMPLNIGGRTNVLFCFFWGILAVVWVKVIYPPMSRAVERIPPLAGTLLTWILVFVMVCNGLLTGAVMLRYNQRAVQPEPANAFEAFLDRQYDDRYVERRWPNMIVTGGDAEEGGEQE